jgi:hypothetical protein
MDKKTPRTMTMSRCGRGVVRELSIQWMWEEKTHCLACFPSTPSFFASPHPTPPPIFLDPPLTLVSCTVCAWISAGLRLCERTILLAVCTLNFVLLLSSLFIFLSIALPISLFLSFRTGILATTSHICRIKSYRYRTDMTQTFKFIMIISFLTSYLSSTPTLPPPTTTYRIFLTIRRLRPHSRVVTIYRFVIYYIAREQRKPTFPLLTDSMELRCIGDELGQAEPRLSSSFWPKDKSTYATRHVEVRRLSGGSPITINGLTFKSASVKGSGDPRVKGFEENVVPDSTRLERQRNLPNLEASSHGN